jgi:hypothetical protein
MIRLDCSTLSVVVTCDECPHWSAFQFTRREAEVSGMNHEEYVHPDVYKFRHRVADARSKRTTRGAATV